MSWFDSTLSNIMRYQEEIEFSIYNLRLLYETLINIGSWRRINDLAICFLKESLSDSFVNNNESYFWSGLDTIFKAILISTDLFKLLKFIVNNLFSHGITNTISINENVIRHISIIEISVSLESTREIFLENI